MAWQARKFYEETGQTVDLGNPNASLLNVANDIIDDGAVEVEAIMTAATGKAGAKCTVWIRDTAPEFAAKFVIKGDPAQLLSIRGYLTGLYIESESIDDSYYYRLEESPQIRVFRRSILTDTEQALPGNSQNVLAAINKIIDDMAVQMWSLLQQYGPPNPANDNFLCFVRSVQGKDILYSIVEV